MVTISISTQSLLNHEVDCYVYIFEKDFRESSLKEIKQIIPEVSLILKKQEFTGNAFESLAIPCTVDGRAAVCIFIGLGELEEKPGAISLIERYRRALGKLVQEASAYKCKSVALRLPSARSLKTTTEHLSQIAATTLKTASYHFGDYFSDKGNAKITVMEVVLVVDEKQKKESQSGINKGMIIGDGVNQARYWVDLPPSALTPKNLAEKAHAIAKKNDLKYIVFDEKQINEMGMGGLAAVSRGSEEDCALIILEYKTKKKTAPTLCFVGKGITFDSGGLSLKPATYMESMKHDMSGAAAVISAIDVLAQLKPNVNIIVIAPTSENLPSGHATKPGDIIRFYNGKTAEVKNTDAEGRLILADALSYAAKHYNPDAMIDLATLTGACAHALGPYYSGLFSQHKDLVNHLKKAGDISGDLLWQLPMNDDYKKAISSSVADICNIGSKNIFAGATTAAHFLQYFVGDVPWAHIDIAGTAFDVPNVSYYCPGATGVGVGLLTELAMNWEN